MSKRLIMILAFVIAAGLAFNAYAEVQNVKVSGDITVYGIMRELGLNNGYSNDTDKSQSWASIARVRVDADLTDNVMATVRLINERYWTGEQWDAASGQDGNTDVNIDLAYVTLKEFLYSPLTLMVGRQELRYGNGMIVGDADTNNIVNGSSGFGGTGDDADLSKRKAFDAVRAVLNYDPLVVDVIYAKINEGTKAEQDDQTLYGINLNYALDKKTTVEGYYFGNYTGRETQTVNKPDRVDVVGARIATSPMDNLMFQLEAAYQFGKRTSTATKTTADRRAWAVETAATYNMPNMKYTPSVTALYAYFTGQKANDNNRYRAWDPMFEDQKFGDIANAQFDQTNAHIAGIMGSAKPTEDVTLIAEYYAFWWDKKYGEGQTIATRRGDSVTMKHNKFAGQELDLKAIYDYTEDVQFGLLTGIFVPGNAFSKGNRNTATEVIGSMTVTF